MKNKIPKISTVKSTEQIAKHSEQLIKLQFPKGSEKDLRCYKCKKKLLRKGQSVKTLFPQSKKLIHKRYHIETHNISFSIDQLSRPKILCRKCSNFIYRSCGYVPEKEDSTVFPQTLSKNARSVKTKDLNCWLGKKKNWNIHYKKSTVTFTNVKYEQLLIKACRQYVEKYPEFTMSVAELFRNIHQNNQLRALDKYLG